MRCALCEDSQKPFLDFMDGGAWLPVGGRVICLVSFVNERDLRLLSSLGYVGSFLEGLGVSNARKCEAIPVVPLDVLGCTRATMMPSTRVWPLAWKGWVTFVKGIVLGIDLCNY